MRRIAMILSEKNYHEDEFNIPLEVFKKYNFKILTVTTGTKEAIGHKGTKTTTDISLDDLSMEDFDIITVIGGIGTKEYLWGNKKLHQLIIDSYRSHKLIGAICLAPVVLAECDILKKGCVYNNKKAKEIFNNHNVTMIDSDLVVDNNIITGKRPKSSKAFAEQIVEMSNAS